MITAALANHGPATIAGVIGLSLDVELRRTQRQFPHTLARGGENGIAERRQRGWVRWFAQPGGRMITLHEQHRDRGDLAIAQYPVVVEIALHHPAPLQRDLLIERR